MLNDTVTYWYLTSVRISRDPSYCHVVLVFMPAWHASSWQAEQIVHHQMSRRWRFFKDTLPKIRRRPLLPYKRPANHCDYYMWTTTSMEKTLLHHRMFLKSKKPTIAASSSVLRQWLKPTLPWLLTIRKVEKSHQQQVGWIRRQLVG